jgi:hypothetical protein
MPYLESKGTFRGAFVLKISLYSFVCEDHRKAHHGVFHSDRRRFLSNFNAPRPRKISERLFPVEYVLGVKMVDAKAPKEGRPLRIESGPSPSA